MFKALQTIVNPSTKAGGYTTKRNNKKASTTFSDSSNPVIKVSAKKRGRQGNGYVACLLKLTTTKYRFRLYAPDGTRLNTITKEDASPPSTVIAQLVNAINANATFNAHIQVTFFNETTEAFSDSVDIGDGQTLKGGR